MVDRKRKKAYISGKIKGVDNYRIKFYEAECFLEVCGYIVVNPVYISDILEFELIRKPTYKEYMKADIKALLDCDIIFMLPNWKRSKGARDEKHIAEITGIEVRYLPK